MPGEQLRAGETPLQEAVHEFREQRLLTRAGDLTEQSGQLAKAGERTKALEAHKRAGDLFARLETLADEHQKAPEADPETNGTVEEFVRCEVLDQRHPLLEAL